MLKSKEIFFYQYNSHCYMLITQSGKRLKVELSGSYFKYSTTYNATIVKNKDVLQDIKAYCNKHTGHYNKRRKLNNRFAQEVLEALESKQLILF